MNRILEILKDLWARTLGKLNRTQLIRLGIGAVLFIALSTFLYVFLTRTEYGVLYIDMDPADAGEVYTELIGRGVDAKVEGNSILVPQQQVDTLRVELMAAGYPKSGLPYQILKEGFGLGTTDSEKRELNRLQLQEDIRKTLIKMDKVRSAIVLLTIGERSPFVLSADTKSTASVQLELRNPNEPLTDEEASDLGAWLQKSVPELTIEDIQIIDTRMNLYDLNVNSPIKNATNHETLRRAVEKQFYDQVMRLLAPVFGLDRVRAEVHVLLDFDQKSSEQTIVTPPIEGSEDGIVISLSELTEKVKNYQNGGTTGFDPNGATPGYVETGGEDALFEKVSREVNYEVNTTKNNIISEQGAVKEVTASIVIDSAFTAEGADVDAEAIAVDVRNMVAQILQTPQTAVTVVRMPFRGPDTAAIEAAAAEEEARIRAARRAELVRLLIIVGSALVLAVMIMLFIRSLTKAMRKGTDKEAVPGLAPGAVPAGGYDFLAADDLTDELGGIKTKKDTLSDQIEKYIEADPAAVAALLRTWLADDYR